MSDRLAEHAYSTNRKSCNERVILFTEYRATQNWLKEVLAQHGFTKDDRLLTMYGGMDLEEREDVKAAFQSGPNESNVRILLATDAAAEGLNLQNHCYRLIHYEIPWNPNRLEQRNGRIDRHGQKGFLHPMVSVKSSFITWLARATRNASSLNSLAEQQTSMPIWNS